MKKPEILLVIAVLLIVAVALFAAFNPHLGEKEEAKEGEHGAEVKSTENISEGEFAQNELAAEIEKGNTELNEGDVLAINPNAAPETENVNETSSANSSEVTEAPIRIQGK